MKYLKHYWISTETGEYLTGTNVHTKRHPESEFDGLDVKIWIKDSDGIDLCLSQVPDSTTITNSVVGSKDSVKELTETEYNSVATPYFEGQRCQADADFLDGDAKTAKLSEATSKYADAKTALNAL